MSDVQAEIAEIVAKVKAGEDPTDEEAKILEQNSVVISDMGED